MRLSAAVGVELVIEDKFGIGEGYGREIRRFNYAYDIQSYDPTEYGLKNRLIEVKSSQRVPPRMIVTRGEWEAAIKYGEAYTFHLWQLPSQELTVLAVEEVASHIPNDAGRGTWSELEITF